MFDRIIDMYIKEFSEKGEIVVASIVNCKVPSDIVLTKYKSLPPIEELPEKEKTEMWSHINETFPDKTREEKIKACKIYYTIGTLL